MRLSLALTMIAVASALTAHAQGAGSSGDLVLREHCSAARPCAMCEGDCDSDKHCEKGLK